MCSTRIFDAVTYTTMNVVVWIRNSRSEINNGASVSCLVIAKYYCEQIKVW